MVQAAISENQGNGNQKPKINEEFIKQIDGKDFVLYSGLLDLAHQKGLKKLNVEVIQYPGQENSNTCICKATAIFNEGEEYSDVGDANAINCNPKVSKHLIRMASTRAKARVFRDATDIGMTCLEEICDMNEVIGEDHANAQNKPRQQRTPARQKASERVQPMTPTSINQTM